MNKKLNVIQLIDSLRAGGAEMMAVNIANGLAEEGVESHICATRVEGSLKVKINKQRGYLFLNKKYSIDLKAIFKLYRYIKMNGITIFEGSGISRNNRVSAAHMHRVLDSFAPYYLLMNRQDNDFYKTGNNGNTS